MTKTSKTQKKWARKALPVLAVVVLMGVLAVIGWRWMAKQTVQAVEVAGARHAPADSLVALASIVPGDTLMAVDPALVADRVVRHPWVQEATVRRSPTGTVHLRVQERTPVALTLDRQGRPAFYLDAGGFMMPLVPGAGYDVPLLRGVEARYHPVTPVADSLLRDLLADLAAADPDANRLLTEISFDGGALWGYAVAPQGTIRIRLEPHAFGNQLARLHAFWRQAVLPQPEKKFQVIDLRFAGQVVTREAAE